MGGVLSRDTVIGVSPFETPNAFLTAAVCRSGGLGVLDLGRSLEAARAELADACRWSNGSFGVRLSVGCPLSPEDLPAQVDTVVLAGGSWRLRELPARLRVLVEVSSPQAAREALAAGAHGLIAKGFEAGGKAGELGTFVLLQMLLSDLSLGVPIWAQGGIGLHTSAAAVAGGARGVVLDSQLALVAEAGLSAPVAAAIRSMDGSETVLIDGYRVYTRPDLPIQRLSEGGGERIAALLGGTDLHSQLIPVGQDGALAAPLADRYRTAGGVIQAVRSAIEEHILQAADMLPPLVVQGPMTRVSDNPGFAAAIAEQGGIPFLALALATSGETRSLMTQTQALLKGKEWGVGILGFATPQVRQAQMEVIRELRPPCVLIAGGRPSQAAPLEAAGIETFLHVPSPALLDRFLREGARRFVFEGSECGGHVGPRASFSLWETQIERILAFGRENPGVLRDITVLFAGGVHDARSSAMVRAMAAPLSHAGVATGVLMGTAYLFTKEAVATGAVLPTYQQTALECGETVLLETSPGHATRCASTAFVDSFEQARRQLAAEGTLTHDQIWAQLEELNLGRLRIATKGLRREGSRLEQVSAEESLAEGMYMMGQVAGMRSEVTSVAELHFEVTTGASELLASRASEMELHPKPASPTSPLDVAIIGMACVFPGAPDVDKYWANVVAGIDSITEVPPERWDPDLYYAPELAREKPGAASPSKWGGFIDPVPFDPLAYGIPPTSLAGIDPAQLLALEVAAKALEHAGYGDRPFDRERASVVFAAEAETDLATAYRFRSVYPSYLGPLPSDLDEHLPNLTEDSFPGVLTNVIAGRIANRLDLGGVNYTVDAACASSLAAVDIACKELRSGTSDLVLCGGVDLHNGVHDYLLFGSAHALSEKGRCAAFDQSADGIALSEGVACVVLKRLEDAERDGDQIFAVIKGIAGSSDGRSLGLTAPRPEGQRRALERAYRMAGIPIEAAGLIEAHGTGTVAGDRAELSTLSTLFEESGVPGRSCALGSVKSQIGHTKCAAGLAGLIKAVHSLRTGVRPGTIHLSDPNSFWEEETSPFFFNVKSAPWSTVPESRVAGVSAFGFGGTNFHAVVSAYAGGPGPKLGIHDWPAELFLVRGGNRAAASEEMGRLTDLIAANDRAGRPWKLRDLAATMAATATGPVQAGIVASSLDDLSAKLASARSFSEAPGVFLRGSGEPGKVALLFPGQGSQRVGMLGDLFMTFPQLQRFLQLAGGAFAPFMFPPTAFNKQEADAQKARLTDTSAAQPSMAIAGLAIHSLLTELGVKADFAAGHSFGELVALSAAGVFGAAELIELSRVRAEAIVEAAGEDRGAMAAVAGTREEVEAALSGLEAVTVANHNAPRQVVISGKTASLETALAILDELGLRARRLPVACAFHTPGLKAAESVLCDALARLELAGPRFGVWSNSTAELYREDPDSIRRTLSQQISSPVRFVDQIEAMYRAGCRVFVEAGPGRVLTGLVGQILGERPHTALPCDVAGENGIERLLLTLAELAVNGLAVDTGLLFSEGRARVVSSDEMRTRPGWVVNGHLVTSIDGQFLPNGLRPARKSELQPASSFIGAGVSDRDKVTLEFLRSTRELVAAQRDVLLSYLGESASGRVGQPPQPEILEAVSPFEPAQLEQAPAIAAGSTLEVTETVLTTISGRTGYPRDMLDAELDLEADLSIDSIKRTEIIGELADRLGLAAAGGVVDDSVISDLASMKTISAIVSWLENHLGNDPGSPEAGRPTVVPSYAPGRLRRKVVEVVELEPLPPVELNGQFAGKRFSIVEDGYGIALELSELLESCGAEVLTSENLSELPPSTDGLIHLGTLRPDAAPLFPSSFPVFREAAVNGVRWLIVATGAGGTFAHNWSDESAIDPIPGAGIRGFIQTVAAEYPDKIARAIDFNLKDSPLLLAERLLAEMAASRSPTVVGYTNGTRCTLRAVERELGEVALGIGPESVVLLTGGARGITAQVAIGLALRTGCHIEIVGRSPLPSGPEDSLTADAPTQADVVRALARSGTSSPSELEAQARRILGEREMRRTLEELGAKASSVHYQAADVRNTSELKTAIDRIYDRHGRLDGVVHGAGILEDRLLKDKTSESFARVWSTKVDGALALAESIRPGTGFIVLFGSVAGVYGNRGQADYAAANDALDTLAHVWSSRLGCRVVGVDWGPWAGGGMVTDALKRQYAQRGISLIEPSEGVAALLRELAAGDAAQVILASD